ncbi:hypothetical protein SAMN05216276_107441 [Streptosporangium subroseum]|uniref:Uncharacterized protein n=1 Tax=Streptosporangium subroseum TaxID=106412 RepID=A0A239NYL6_9ACTN|nr:hypothetical protein SAMN05216276_107441 [Streptosporangium subroseum]
MDHEAVAGTPGMPSNLPAEANSCRPLPRSPGLTLTFRLSIPFAVDPTAERQRAGDDR